MKATRAQVKTLMALEEIKRRLEALEGKVDELLARVPEKAPAAKAKGE